MAFSTRLDLRQSQSLVMTPQLQQAIKLLQLSNLELAAYVETELEQNPLLVRDEGESDPQEAIDADTDGERASGDLDDQIPDSAEMASTERLADQDDAPLDLDLDQMWDGAEPEPTGASAISHSSASAAPIGDMSVEHAAERPDNLREHLLRQVEMSLDDPADRIIGRRLVDLVDETGYLSGDLDPVAAALGCQRDRLDQTLSRLQQFDPAGVFARSLGECLEIQLRDRNRYDPAMQALIDNLDLLARHDAAGLLKVCGVDAEDLSEMIAELRSLDPKPGLAFDQWVSQPVTPDVLMRAGRDGWIIELNAETLPRVLVDRQYHAKVSSEARGAGDQEYIAECFQTANWLVKALHQRATTILRVATQIVRQQDGFFRHGVQHLRPLILRDIAELIEMHESTVSRVTTNKFIATPRGIFELKYFFTTAIPSRNGADAHSAESVRQRIRSMIDGEASSSVLSDDGIAEMLLSEGIDIARRTVAKYRESMRIPSSVQRRREKAMRL